MMNPFSSRCCQHNHAAGWVYYAENSWMATPDNGLVAQLYSEDTVSARVGKGALVKLIENTKYPFDETVQFTVQTKNPVSFPLYLRIPAWTNNASLKVNSKALNISPMPGTYLKLTKKWKQGDKIILQLPMELKVR